MSDGNLVEQAMQMAKRFGRNKGLTGDQLCDAISMAWQLGQAGRGSPGSIAWYAVKRVRSERQFSSWSRSIEHLSRGNAAVSLESSCLDVATERDNPAEIAQMRVDFESWREQLPDRMRQVVDLLSAGMSPSELADQLGVSRARVSQLRNELADDWQGFTLS